jgi:signal peptidase II
MTNPSESTLESEITPPATVLPVDSASSASPAHAAPALRGARDSLFWSLVIGGLALDFASKRIVEAELLPHLPRNVIGDWVRFTLIYNPGAAMNLSFGASSRVVFSVIACIMFVVLFRMLLETRADDRAQTVALGLIASGAIGNLVDRIRSVRGVVDFIDVGIGDSRFYTFNVADSFVTVGAILLAILLWRQPEPEQKS